jgi:Arc/MetJ-type ribon-helix-helix transcriptional regulator
MISVRMPDDRVSAIDDIVASGSYASRASVIIDAIDRLVAELESEAIDRAIVEGYRRIPSTREEDEWAEWSARASIREEPW